MSALSISLALAALSHRLVEDPVRRWRWLSSSRARTIVLGVLLTALSVGAGAGLTWNADRLNAADQAAAHLSMSPQQASADVITGLQGCHVGFGTTVAASPSHCLFGDPKGTSTVVLIGDSHAEHWFPALDALAKARHWKLYEWSKDSCAVNAAPEWLDIYNRAYPQCAQWRVSLLHQLATLHGVDHIVVARSFKYVNYTMSGPIGAPTGTARLTSTAAVGKEWQAGERPVLEALHAISPHVTVLSDGPAPPVDIPTCLSQHPSDVSDCSFTRAGHTDLDTVLDTAERRAAAGIPGISFVNPTDLICGTGPVCPAVRDGLIVYRDGGHMTQTFSRTLAPVVGRAFHLD